jgi:uncharacterized protein YbjT (DUF2867 family)
MKIVVIGGSGLIGSKLVPKLRERGHEGVAASPKSGVNTVTGEGLAEVVVDVSNAPSWEDAAVLKFFETSTRNLLTYAAAAGVGHHVALSVVGTDRLSESGYFRAKIAQERLIKESSIPYSIVRATQFFEFLTRGLPTFPSKAARCICRLYFSSPWLPTMQALRWWCASRPARANCDQEKAHE